MEDQWSLFVQRQRRALKEFFAKESERNPAVEKEVREQKLFLQQRHPLCMQRGQCRWESGLDKQTRDVIVVANCPRAGDYAPFASRDAAELQTQIRSIFGSDPCVYMNVYPFPLWQWQETGSKRVDLGEHDPEIFLNLMRLRILAIRPLTLFCIGQDTLRWAADGFAVKEQPCWTKMDLFQAQWRGEKRGEFSLNLNGWRLSFVPCIPLHFVRTGIHGSEGERMELFCEWILELKKERDRMLAQHRIWKEQEASVQSSDTFVKMRQSLEQEEHARAKEAQIKKKKKDKEKHRAELRREAMSAAEKGVSETLSTKWARANRDQIQKFATRLTDEQKLEQFEKIPAKKETPSPPAPAVEPQKRKARTVDSYFAKKQKPS